MPNQYVQVYRRKFPEDQRSDDELTADAIEVHGLDAFTAYPDVVSDYQRIQSKPPGTPETMTAEESARMYRELFPTTIGDRVGTFVGALGRGAANVVSSIPESVAIAAHELGRRTGIGDKPLEDMTTFRLAEGIRDKADRMLPEINPGLRESFWNTKVPSGLGSAAGFMGGGVAGAALKLPRFLSIAGLGSMANAVELYHDAEESGADPETRWQAFLLGAGVGTTEAVPLARILDRIDKVSGNTLKQALFNAGKASFEESIQEAIQSASTDVIAARILKYDEDRKMFESVLEEASVGGVVGATVSLLASAVGVKLSRMRPDSGAGDTPGAEGGQATTREAPPRTLPPIPVAVTEEGASEQATTPEVPPEAPPAAPEVAAQYPAPALTQAEVEAGLVQPPQPGLARSPVDQFIERTPVSPEAPPPTTAVEEPQQPQPQQPKEPDEPSPEVQRQEEGSAAVDVAAPAAPPPVVQAPPAVVEEPPVPVAPQPPTAPPPNVIDEVDWLGTRAPLQPEETQRGRTKAGVTTPGTQLPVFHEFAERPDNLWPLASAARTAPDVKASMTHRRTVLEKDGAVWVLATWGTDSKLHDGTRRKFVSVRNPQGKGSIELAKLLDQGYQLRASLLAEKAVDGPKAKPVAMSADQWQEMAKDGRQRMQSQREKATLAAAPDTAFETDDEGNVTVVQTVDNNIADVVDAVTDTEFAFSNRLAAAIDREFIRLAGEEQNSNAPDRRSDTEVANDIVAAVVQDKELRLELVDTANRIKQLTGSLLDARDYITRRIISAYNQRRAGSESIGALQAVETWDPAGGVWVGQTLTAPDGVGGQSGREKASAAQQADSGLPPAKRRVGEVASYHPAHAVRQLWTRALETLAAMGFDVSVIARDSAALPDSFFFKAGNGVINGNTVATVVNDLANPDSESALAALHELGHAVFEAEPADRQAQLQRAISKLDLTPAEAAQAQQQGLPPGRQAEEVLVERIAQNLVSEGFDPGRADTWSKRLVRALKDLMIRVGVWLQSNLLGPDHISPTLALRYFQNRVESTLLGLRVPTGFVQFMGGGKPGLSTTVSFYQSANGFLERVPYILHGDGRVVVNDFVPLTADAAIENIQLAIDLGKRRDLVNVNEAQPVGGEDPTANATGDVMAARHVDYILQEMFKEGQSIGVIGKDTTFNGFLDQVRKTGRGPLDRPADILAGLEYRLSQLKAKQVDPGLNLRGPALPPNPAATSQAQAKALQSLNAWRSKWNETLAEMEVQAKQAEREQEKLVANQKKLWERYGDTEWVKSNGVVDDVKKLLRDVQADYRDQINANHRLGALAQIAKQLQAEEGAPLTRQYVKLIENVAERIFKRGESFVDFLTEVAGLSIDFRNLPLRSRGDTVGIIDRLRAVTAKSPFMQGLNQTEQEVAIGIVSAFAKDNDHVMALLEIKQSKNWEKIRQIKEVLDAAALDTRGDLAAARKLIEKLPGIATAADRILQKYRQASRRLKIVNEHLDEAREFIKMHERLLPALNLEIGRLERAQGAMLPFFDQDGVELPVPPSKDSTVEEVAKATVTLNFRGKDALTDKQLWEHINKIDAWLANNEATGGAMWGHLDAASRALKMMNVQRGQMGIRQSLMMKLFGSLSDVFQDTGTQNGRKLAQMLRQYIASYSPYSTKVDPAGRLVADAKKVVMKKMRIKDPKEFDTQFLDAALDLWNKHTELDQVPPDQWRSEWLRINREYFGGNPFVTEKTWPLLVKYWERVNDANTLLNKIAKEMGVKVYDPVMKIYRDMIGDPRRVHGRRFAKHMQSLWMKMRDAGWMSTKKEQLNSAQIAEAYAENPDEARQSLAKYFTADVWEKFVGEMARRPGRSLFSGAKYGDGTYALASVDNTIKAYETAGGDVVTFAENLAALEGIDQAALPAFIGETIDTLQNAYNALTAIMVERESDSKHQGGDISSVPRVMMDARIAEWMPAAWLEYGKYDQHHMRMAIQSMAFHAAFGRNSSNFLKAIHGAKQELYKGISDWDDLKGQVPGTGLTVAERARQAEKLARAQGKSESDILFMKYASDNLRALEKTNEQFGVWFKNWGMDAVETRSLLEIISTIAALLVQGPKTAFLQTSDMSSGIIIRMGANRTALRMIFDSWSFFLKTALGSHLQVFSISAEKMADDMLIMHRTGALFDPDTQISLSQRINSELGVDMNLGDTASGRVAQSIVKGLRIVRGVVMEAGMGRGVFPTLKPLSPFGNIVKWMNAGLVHGFWQTSRSMVAKGVEYLRAHPDALSDPSFRFKAADLGMPEMAFQSMNEAFQRWGVMLETLAKRNMDTKNARDFFTDDEYRALAEIAKTEISLEAGPTTNPRAFGNPMVRYFAPLMRWTFSRTNKVARVLREPNGEASWAAYKTAMGMFALGILPVGIAYGIAMHEYDEKVTGKKSNLRAYGEGDLLTAFIEQQARVGTFGLFGDFANQIVNIGISGDLRGMSFDSRVIFANSLNSMMAVTSALIRQETADYPTIYRPLLSALGGSGYLQVAQIINNAVSDDITQAIPLVGDLLEAERRVTARVNISNWLRSSGRAAGLDVRISTGRPMSMPTPIKPHVGQMYLSALANNPADFNTAYRKALAAAAKHYPDRDPEDYVKRSFSAYHPLKTVFRTSLTEQEYFRLLSQMPETGRQAVAEGVALLNSYGRYIGVTPFEGKKEVRRPVARASYRTTFGL